jgi:uncharacterized protein (DUF885 family)
VQTRRLYPAIVLLCLAGFVGSCKKAGTGNFPVMAQEFVGTTMAFSPTAATAQGYHTHIGKDLDTELDDVSSNSISLQRNFYAEFHRKLETVEPNQLSPEDQADYNIIQDQIALALQDLDIVQTWRHNPTWYVELIGNGLFAPYVLEYDSKDTRVHHVISRVQKVPEFLDRAKRNLFHSPAIWIKVAKEENQGNIHLIDTTLRAWIPDAQKEAYSMAAEKAILELREFDRFLTDQLPNRRGGRSDPDWRLGSDVYRLKFRFALGTDLTPDQVLASAETDLKRVHGEMYEIAKQLGCKGDGNQAIREALGRIADKHSTPETYFTDAKDDLAEARAFVQQKNLLSLPNGSNLQVIETPEFMRGIYSVGGFNPAPALEPNLGAFYWITPIPKDWDKTRIESKLREYNFINLKILTIHEAMPGHYVQGEFANQIQPKTRRVLRSVFGSTATVEGWAQYATQVMVEEGFLDHSPELKLSLLKQELRVLANAIIDIRFQTNRMTEQQALDLMEKETYQEHEEATGKIQRAQLSSAQLPAYLVGWRDWNRVREQYKKTKGSAYSLHDFHDAALKEGAVPTRELAKLVTGKPLTQ